jgi:hypothetical protein
MGRKRRRRRRRRISEGLHNKAVPQISYGILDGMLMTTDSILEGPKGGTMKRKHENAC